MNILAWVVLGLLAGAMAKIFYSGRHSSSIFVTILLGVAGAIAGGMLINLLEAGTLALASTTLSIPGAFVAALGALIAIFLYYQFTHPAY